MSLATVWHSQLIHPNVFLTCFPSLLPSGHQLCPWHPLRFSPCSLYAETLKLVQGPHVESVIQDKRLALPDSAGDPVEVEAARQTFAYLRQYLLSLETEVNVLESLPVRHRHYATASVHDGPIICNHAEHMQFPLLNSRVASAS